MIDRDSQKKATNSQVSTPIASHAVTVAIVLLSFSVIAILGWQLAQVLLLAFGAVLVAVFFRAIAEGIAHATGYSYGWSLALGFAALILLSIVALYASGDPVADQMEKLADEIPRSLEEVVAKLQDYSWGERLLNAVPQSTEEMPFSKIDVTSYVAGMLSSATGVLGAAIVVIFLALYFAVDPSTYCDGFVRLFPVRRRSRITEVLHDAHEVLRWWLLGKMVAMVLVGTLTTIGLWLLGIPLPIALGVIAALLTFIPNFGPVIAAVPALLLAFVESPMSAVYVGVLYLVIQTVESYLITPLILQRTVSLPPALTVVAQVGMGVLLGVPGIVLAAPVAAMSMVFITKLYIEDRLESDEPNSKTDGQASGS